MTLKPTSPVVRLAGLVFAFALSPDRRLVATSNVSDPNTSTVVVFDVTTGALMATLTDLDTIVPAAGAGRPTVRFVETLSFSADSKRLAASTLAGGAVVWDLVTHAVTPLATGNREVEQIAFDHVGRQLVTVSGAGALTVYDAATLTKTSAPFFGRVQYGPDFHPSLPLLITDGSCLAYAGYRDIALWDTTGNIEIGIGFQMNCAFWLPDGTGFVGKNATSIQIWDIDPEAWVRAACNFVSRPLNEDEWAKYGPAKPYRDTCAA